MAFISTGVEYALHCLLFIADGNGEGVRPGSKDLAELQGIPAEFTAKLFTRLQKASLIETTEGVRGGIALARTASDIAVHDVVIAIDGDKPMFECREIRANCALFDGAAPDWATSGLCGIHAVMREAEEAMRARLREVTLADLAGSVGRKAPLQFADEVAGWLTSRVDGRRQTAKEPKQ